MLSALQSVSCARHSTATSPCHIVCIMLEMEKTNPESCQNCLRAKPKAGSQPQTQWISVCRCDRTYSPNAQFSIDVCAICKRRAAPGASTRVRRSDICCCEKPDLKKVPSFLKQNESDAITLDLAPFGLSQESFPLEKYAPVAILGETARAYVFLCRDRQRGTKVAVKCYKQTSPGLQCTLESEARKSNQVGHARIAKVVDCGIFNGTTPYLVTEYKDGFSLEQCLALYGLPSHDVAATILIGICDALAYAHKQGKLHRNIRPGNIIFLDDMNSEPSVVLTDFAIPKVEELTEPCDVMYISSDEARGLDYNEKSEMYSIACVGFALMTGRPPFQDGTALEIKNMHALKLPPRISNLNFDSSRPTDLEEVIERCLEKDRSNRFESLSKLLERLEVFPRRQQLKIAAVQSTKKQKMIVRIGAAGVIVAALCAVGYFVFGPH